LTGAGPPMDKILALGVEVSLIDKTFTTDAADVDGAGLSERLAFTAGL
jgi:hypothetical protein